MYAVLLLTRMIRLPTRKLMLLLLLLLPPCCWLAFSVVFITSYFGPEAPGKKPTTCAEEWALMYLDRLGRFTICVRF